MGQLVLLVVAAAWAAVLVPPLLRSRIENRPNSSVSDFRAQLSSLQRAVPARGGSMRGMARPLAPSPLSRPAAAGRPGRRSAQGRSTQGRSQAPQGSSVRLNGQQPARRRADIASDAAPRGRTHAAARPRPAHRDALKRRRANVLFVLVLTVACTVFLAATTSSPAMVWLAVISVVCLLGYVCLLGQMRQRDLQRELREAQAAPAPRARPQPARGPRDEATAYQREAARSRSGGRRREWHTGPVRRQHGSPAHSSDRYSHAV
jgi:hypothetical protein